MAAAGTAPAILNAANEVAVQAFLEHQIRFTDIPRVIENTLEQVTVQEAAALEIVLETDFQARQVASKQIRCLT